VARAQGTSGGSCALDVAHSCPSVLLPAPAWPSCLLAACARASKCRRRRAAGDMDAGRPETGDRRLRIRSLASLALTNRSRLYYPIRPSIDQPSLWIGAIDRAACMHARPALHWSRLSPPTNYSVGDLSSAHGLLAPCIDFSAASCHSCIAQHILLSCVLLSNKLSPFEQQRSIYRSVTTTSYSILYIIYRCCSSRSSLLHCSLNEVQ